MVTAKEIPPGGVGEIKATFRSRGYNGKVQKVIRVETNDPDNPRVSLSLSGEVISEVMVTPRYVNFRNVKRDALPKPVSLEIKLLEDKGLKIQKVSVDNPYIVLKEEKSNQSGAVYSVSLAQKVPTGRLTGKILIRTNSKKSPKTEVPYYAFVEGRVKVSPKILSLGVIRPGQATSRDITLSVTGDVPLSVEQVKASTDAVTTQVVPEEGGKSCLIHVTYNPEGRTQGRVSERLTIVVGGKDQEVLEVPIYGTIHEAPAPAAQNNPQ